MFYDRITLEGASTPVRVRSMVGIIPMLAVAVVDEQVLDPALATGKQFARFLDRHGLREPAKLVEAGILRGEPGSRRLFLGAVDAEKVNRLLTALFDPAELLSPYGLRSMSARHRDHPA